ncbi:hypothetical protein TUM4438_40700 [Shewanella sairae]|uniref:Flp family type IVb pilin n=1 Tax=Shewanella sairae TaxID=190310 RepID=A0ABQ4PQP1_9GAMM|nr:Flp family type IVb pilin [Shewanella sairae]MCL1132456.1 Flp family type IVb pilin [Shewanella sairae]GIU51359.1 hypothetical protein TUM4438_40700 [Shewanella sairae]
MTDVITHFKRKNEIIMKNLINKLVSFYHDQRGVTAVEYAIIAVAMSAIVLAVYTNGDLGTAMTDAMSTVSENITGAKTVPTP